MFSGFWGWFLVVIIVAAIFGAGNLPELKKIAEEKFKFLTDAAQKGKKQLETKIHDAKQDHEKAKKENSDNEN